MSAKEICNRQVGDESRVRAFSMIELTDALKNMGSNKAADSNGIVAELLKLAGEPLWDILLDVFNDILLHGSEPPDSWRKTRLIVIMKKGDPKLPSNYRPIAL
eukprot:2427123-Karenia_brevis.AAC.1